MIFDSLLCVLLVPFIFPEGLFVLKIEKAVFDDMHRSEAREEAGTKIYATKQQEEKGESLDLAALFRISLPFSRSILNSS